jgi:hypothetical protein
MLSALWLPLVMAAAFIIVVARATVYRPRYRLEEVIRFVRKLEITDLAALFDPAEEWALRALSSERDFRAAQQQRLRLAREYLRRIGHNAEVIQTWVGALYENIRHKPREDFTSQDYLVWNVLELATEVRVCHLMAVTKISLWVLLRAHRWPAWLMPHVSKLRMIGEVDLVKKYRILVEDSTSLSSTYGRDYCEQLTAAL